MRQAGRYLPEYRELRKGRTMLETIESPDLAAQITLQPLQRFPLDAAILFSDLTIPFTPMGAPFELKEGIGPVVHEPIREPKDIAKLRPLEPEEDLPYVLETIRILKRDLKVPLIGFTGAPFTLACYLIEGGPSRDMRLTRQLMYSEPELWHRLMSLLAESATIYLSAQLAAGADAVQLFDSWVGVLDGANYREFLLPHMNHLFSEVAKHGKPIIHFGTGNPALLAVMSEAGGDVIGVDWRISLSEASKLAPGKPLQGNLDPALLLAGGQRMLEQTETILEQGRKLPGHIFNLGHGIYPNTPIGHVEQLLDAVTGAVRVG